MGLLELDHLVFNYINQDLSSFMLDVLMIMLSNNFFYFLLMLGILYCAYRTKDTRITYALCVAAVAAAASDLFVYEVLKPFFARYRPCQGNKQVVRAILGCAGRYGFPSNHAANGMAIAATVWLIAGRKWGLVGVSVVLLVGLSRLYLGMHYPLDVLAGFLVGLIFAFAVYIISRPISKVMFGRVL